MRALALVALVFVAGCKSGDQAAFDAAASNLEKVKKQAAELGLPIEPKQGETPANPQEDAGPLYRQVVKKYLALSGETRVEVQRISNWDDPLQRDRRDGILRKFRPRYLPIVEEFVRATEMPTARFGSNYELGMLLQNDMLGPLRSIGKVVGFEAALAAKQGDFDRAEKMLRALYRLADHIDDEPRQETLLARLSTHRLGLRASEIVLNMGKGSLEAQTAVKQAREGLAPFDFKTALRGEVAIGLATMRFFKVERDGVRYHAVALASLFGTEQDPKATEVLAKLDEMPAEPARLALQTRLLEAWIRAWPKLTAEDPNELAAQVLTHVRTPEQLDPSMALIRTGYSDILTVAHGIELATAHEVALNAALTKLAGKPVSEDVLTQHEMKLEPQADGFRIITTRDRMGGAVPVVFSFRG